MSEPVKVRPLKTIDPVAVYYKDGSGSIISGSTTIDTATGTQQITNVADAVTSTLEATNLSAVTATGAGPAINSSKFNKITVVYIATSVSSGGTVKTQGSLDNTNWVDLDTETISATGNTSFTISGEKWKYIRTNVTARTDGTYTTQVIAGN